MTEPGRVALLLAVAWLLAAVAVLAVQGVLLFWLLAAAASSAVLLVLRALVRQQRAPSLLDRPPLPERYRVADDLTLPLEAVIVAAEREALTGSSGGARAAGATRPCPAATRPSPCGAASGRS